MSHGKTCENTNMWVKTCEITTYVKVMDLEEFTELRKNSWKKKSRENTKTNDFRRIRKAKKKLVKTLKKITHLLSYGLFKRIC